MNRDYVENAHAEAEPALTIVRGDYPKTIIIHQKLLKPTAWYYLIQNPSTV